MKKILLLLISFLPFITFSQIQIGQDIDGESPNDFSGRTMTLSGNGNVVAIGSVFNDENGLNSGHVRIFDNNNGMWLQIGEDIDGESESDFSGDGISLSEDGSIIAIGAISNDGNGNSSGHVRVFENSNGVWTQIGENINGEMEGDNSGRGIILSADGTIIAIGAEANDGNGSLSGHVRVFENTNGNWVQIGQDINGENTEDLSGGSISLSENGNILAIGDPANDGGGSSSGHVRVFENNNGNWIQIGENINGEMEGDNSGNSISLSADGTILAIGAFLNGTDNSGHVRVFENTNGNWVQIGQDINGENNGDFLGANISLSNTGNIIAIGVSGSNINGSNSGQVKIFENSNGNWIQIGENINGESADDSFGITVSLSSDGSVVAIGADGTNGNGSNSGSVRVFDLSELLSTNENIIYQFELFPNPARDILNIQLQHGVILKKINIYNNIGQLLLTTKDLVIETSKLSKGIYFIEVITNTGKTSKKLIVK